MGKVVYANTPTRADQETLRESGGVRVVTEQEEGSGVNILPDGVFGYTYSPGLPNAPLFATRRYRSYEIHRVAGEVFIVGFVTADAARDLSSAPNDVTVQLHPEPDSETAVLVKVPYSRIHTHRQYAAPNQQGFTVTLRSYLSGAAGPLAAGRAGSLDHSDQEPG
ncbi:MAG: hypothetical protein EXQ48_08900 [Acidobacteria bacterium]|nr:hypothetical protein [Acidobacteriota bacterium]